MIKRRRAAFDRAHALLSELKERYPHFSSTAFARQRLIRPLMLLQKLLIKEIMRTERKIRGTKATLKAIDTAASPSLAVELEERIKAYRYLAYNWRCFGDGVAFLFMDKFSLKQTYLNTHNLNPKQNAGFLSDKEGLKAELAFVDRMLKIGVPALLTDLTNTIRHGDVCLMVGPDPQLFEVKSGKVNDRGKRQQKSIRKLQKFLETDEANEIRGLKGIQRRSPNTQEVTYINVMNECIAAATKSGAAWRMPEAGLYYLVIADESVSIADVTAKMGLRCPWVFLLNQSKSEMDWAPYMPYTLSITDRDPLFHFIWGDISLVVFYEIDVLCRLAECEGLEIKFNPPNSDYAFEITMPGGAGPIKLGYQLFLRLAFDFTSPEWLFHLAAENLNHYESAAERDTDETGSIPKDLITEILLSSQG